MSWIRYPDTKRAAKPKVTQHLHQQPAGVATGAAPRGERLLRRLHAWLHADDVGDVFLQQRIELDKEIRGPPPLQRDAIEEGLQPLAHRVHHAVNRQVLLQLLRIGEGPELRLLHHEEVERVVDRHVGDEVDFDLQLAHRLREHEAGKPVAVRVLLVVDEVTAGADLQRVREHARAGVRRGTQADDLGSQHHGLVVLVPGQVMEGGLDGHRRTLSVAAARKPKTVGPEQLTPATTVPAWPVRTRQRRRGSACPCPRKVDGRGHPHSPSARPSPSCPHRP